MADLCQGCYDAGKARNARLRDTWEEQIASNKAVGVERERARQALKQKRLRRLLKRDPLWVEKQPRNAIEAKQRRGLAWLLRKGAGWPYDAIAQFLGYQPRYVPTVVKEVTRKIRKRHKFELTGPVWEAMT